jgi:hypothetical protein
MVKRESGMGHWGLGIGHWLFLPYPPHLPYLPLPLLTLISPLPYLTESLLLLSGLGKGVVLLTFLSVIKMS